MIKSPAIPFNPAIMLSDSYKYMISLFKSVAQIQNMKSNNKKIEKSLGEDYNLHSLKS